MIVITVHEDRPLDTPDELGRTRTGYRDGMDGWEIYRAARGSWVLGTQADREHYALVVHSGHVVGAFSIDRIVDSGTGRRTIDGAPLSSDHPVYREYVGKPSPVPAQRNPIRYFDSPVGHPLCRCNCGATVPSGDFLSGHDQTALHDRVRQIGTVAEFLDWFDALQRPFKDTQDTKTAT